MENEFSREPKELKELTEFWLDDNILPTENFLKENYWPDMDKWYRLHAYKHWDDYEEWDRFYFSSDNPPTKITVNMVTPAIKQMIAYALSRKPYISCHPQRPEDTVAAALAETSANYEWRHSKFQKHIRKAFLHACITGWGVGEVGYTRKVDAPENIKDGSIEWRDYIKDETAYFRWINNYCFYQDLTQKNLDDARWCCERFHQTPFYVVNNSNYIASVRSDIEAGKYKPEFLSSTAFPYMRNVPESMKQMYTLYRVWDKKLDENGKKRMYIFCRGVDKPLFIGEWTWDYLDSFPIKMIHYDAPADDYYGTGLIKPVEDLQFERNRIRTAMFHYRRTNVGGQLQADSEVDDKEIRKYLQGVKVIKIPVGTEGMRKIDASPMTPEQFAIDRVIEQDAEKQVGLPAWAQGSTNLGRRAATEISKSAQFTELRIAGVVENLDEFIEDIASDLIKHIKMNYDGTRMAALSGPMAEYWGRVVMPGSPEWAGVTQQFGGKYWVPFTKDDISGEYDMEIESTSKPRTDPTTEIQNLTVFQQDCAAVATLSAQLQQPPNNIAGINFIEILREKADKLGLKNTARFIPAAGVIPPPIQEQTAMQAQQGGGTPAPEQMPQMPPEQQQMMQQAVNPQSAMAGALLGRFNGQQPS